MVAGAIIAAHLRAKARDPLARLLDDAGLGEVLRLLATGSLSDDALRAHAEMLLGGTRAIARRGADRGFARGQVRATPYAYARDMTGETVLGLIEADPFARDADLPPILSDGNWLRLQGICGG